MEFRTLNEDHARRSNLIMWAVGALSALVYALTLSHFVSPGESADLVVQAANLESSTLPLHPVWKFFAGGFAALPLGSLAIRLNLFSMVCSVVSVMLIYRIMVFFVHDVINEEHSIDYAPQAAILAGSVTALAYAFAVPVWRAASALHYQSFDMMLVFGTVVAYSSWAKKQGALRLLFFTLLCGLGLLESVMFLPLLPLFIGLIAYAIVRNGRWSLARMTWVLFLIALFAVLGYVITDCLFVSANGQGSALSIFFRTLRAHVTTLNSGIPRVSWLLLLLTGVIPWVAGMFASFRALNNERTWSEYILHLSMTIFVVLGLANSAISPWAVLRGAGRLPVASYAMLAMTAGYLVAYWYLLLKVKQSTKKGVESVSAATVAAGEWFSIFLVWPMVAFVVVVAIANAFSCGGGRGRFADVCANAVLDRLGGRTWFISDGALDSHLRIQAAARGIKLNIIALQNDMNSAYLKKMSKTIEKEKLFEGEELRQMKRTLSLGILPFVQDWFQSDTNIAEKVAVFGVPDFWYIADQLPRPEFFFFGGIKDASAFADPELHQEYTKFWDEMLEVLPPVEVGAEEANEPIDVIGLNLRRHLGFVANNYAVLVEDAALKLSREKKDDPRIDKLYRQAFETYTFIREKIDKNNISALFNRFEMARNSLGNASERRESIERELKDFIQNLKQRYPLYSLSRMYGYVRTPELFARLGWSWALSGQTGAALAGIRSAIYLLPTEKRSIALSSLASIYAVSGENEKTEKIYRSILRENPNDESAMLGLVRLSVQQGSIEQARAWLEKAAKTNTKRGAFGVEWATIHLLNGDLAAARVALQETTDLQPKNLQAWSMLALVQIQQGEFDDVEKVTLPKMETIAGTANNYFLQIASAQLAIRRAEGLKNENLLAMQRRARSHLLRAASLRPDITGVKDMILQLDIAMNDQKNGELHARQVLRSNRKHALANYILGSLRLQEGSYGEAEDFLRRSVEEKATGAALNDLAETLHRIHRYDEAEKFARQAIEKAPKLYVVWETLAVILLEENKDIAEARTSIEKAIELNEDDWRVRITYARILLKQGEVELARGVVAQIRAHRDELPEYDALLFENVAKEASAAKLK